MPASPKPVPSRKLIILAVSVVLLIFAFFARFPRGPRPVCHKALCGALTQFLIESSHTNAYPNGSGHEDVSLAMVSHYFGSGLEKYGYVPGLHDDDSTNLVLMYMRVKTRHSWHGDTKATLFSPKRWMVLGPGFSPADGMDGKCAEGGELLETLEFKRRFQDTLTFLEQNRRPYWQTIVAEQSKFVNSLHD